MRENEYTCREGDKSDLPELAELFRRHNFAANRADILDWKYFKNPDGPAKMYLGIDSKGAIVATRIYLPRIFTSLKTGDFLVRQSVDLLVAKEHRGSGVYSKVRELQTEKRDYPAIGLPNERAKLITRTFPGTKRVYYPLIEWRYPIAPGNVFQSRPYAMPAPLAKGLSRLYTFLWLGKHQKNIQLIPITRFERDYSLDPHYIHGVRSAEYLNWRFIDNPLQSYFCHEFVENGRSLGYCVHQVCDSIAVIFDLVLTDRKRGCLRALVDQCRSQGITQLAFTCVGFRMRKLGFLKSGKVGDLDTADTPPGDWLITLADKD